MKRIYYLIAIILCQVLASFTLVSNAQQQPPQPSPTPVQPPAGSTPQTVPQSSPQTTPRTNPRTASSSIIGAEVWGRPYWIRRNICRSTNVNMICLTRQQAKRLRWSIPTRKAVRA